MNRFQPENPCARTISAIKDTLLVTHHKMGEMRFRNTRFALRSLMA
jgi:hypothetical protein